MGRFILCFAFLLLCFRPGQAAPEASPLRLRLEFIREPKSQPGTLPVRFWIENTSREAFSITRPTYPYGAHLGWGIRINGPGGVYNYITVPVIYPSLNNTDFVPLRGWEIRGELTDLTAAVRFEPAQGSKPARNVEILKTPGHYTATVVYFMPAESLKQAKMEAKDAFTGSLESNTVTFEVRRNGKVEIKGR